MEYNELFKLYLDPHYQDSSEDAPTLQEARRWFQDYLSCLHAYLQEHFIKTVPRFEQKRIEYVFSVPTTWKDPATIARTEGLIRAAGFGSSENKKNRASVYLTEAEAAAVYTSKQSMDEEDVFLVCDIGGGTTDLNVLKVKSAHVGNVELEPLSWVEGMAVGSILIDFKAQQAIKDRLQLVRAALPDGHDLNAVVSRMTSDTFVHFKCSFGNENAALKDLRIPIPEISPDFNSVEAGIESSNLVFRV